MYEYREVKEHWHKLPGESCEVSITGDIQNPSGDDSSLGHRAWTQCTPGVSSNLNHSVMLWNDNN